MDLNTFIINFVPGLTGGLAGGLIALIGNYMSYRNQNKILKKQIHEQNLLFEKQVLYNKQVEKDNALSQKIEAATMLYNLIPEIVWEGFQNKNYPIAIFSKYDFINSINVLRDEFEKTEVLYLVKLFANIESIKMATPSSNDFRNSYVQLLNGFCNGYVNCGICYYKNIENRKSTNKMPYDIINESQSEQLTKDYIMRVSYSDFINSSGNDIYSKLEKIKDCGTAKF